MNKILICLRHSEIFEHFVSQLWNMKLLYNAHKKTTFDKIMSQMNPVHTFLMNHSNQLIILSQWNLMNSRLELKNLDTGGLAAPCTLASNKTVGSTM